MFPSLLDQSHLKSLIKTSQTPIFLCSLLERNPSELPRFGFRFLTVHSLRCTLDSLVSPFTPLTFVKDPVTSDQSQ